MFITNESIHKLESVTITIYVPSVRSLISCVISPLLHWYVYGPDTRYREVYRSSRITKTQNIRIGWNQEGYL